MQNLFPHALFSLIPLNPQAESITADPRNRSYAFETCRDHDRPPTFAISVGFHIASETRNCHTIATLGRGDNADIYLQGSSISKSQCSFEVNLDTKVVMLYDRSSHHSTQVYGQNATPFEHGRPLPRRVVVDHGLNEFIGIGGPAQDLIQFRLDWLADGSKSKQLIEKWQLLAGSYQEESETNPRGAHTSSQQDSGVQSRMDTTSYTPVHLKMRYRLLSPLSSGSFGAVYRALDYDTGRFMAVKKE